MADKTCTMCWKEKDTGRVHPDANDSAMVCAGCRYDVQRTLGYLGYHGMIVVSAADGDAFHEAARAKSPGRPLGPDAETPKPPKRAPGNKGKEAS